MNPYQQFKRDGETEVAAQGADRELASLSMEWMNRANRFKYSYHFEWMGRPLIQYPQDVVAMQELIWAVKPDLIVETGIAHGGSLIFSASMLALLDLMDFESGGVTRNVPRQVVGIDIDIRSHNRQAIEEHPLASRRIRLLQGSSVDQDVIGKVQNIASTFDRVLVCLDSNHTHDHVLAELEAYAPLASPGSYCVVFDTVIEDMPADMFPDRPWRPGNNPKTAVWEYLKAHDEFEIDRSIQQKLMVTVAPDGFLKRIR